MGYLDHSTNNIILDAVLTDAGRDKLSKNTFLISNFALGDNEIDYTIIKKYGRTVGKEKIEKNTPVFEALTNQEIALKFPIISLPSGNLSSSPTFPILKLVGDPPALSRSTSTKPITIEILYKGTAATATDISNNFGGDAFTKFRIKYSSRFFRISGNSIDTQEHLVGSDPNRTQTSLYTSSQGFNDQITFNIVAKTIDSTTFAIYGGLDGSAKRVITSNITVTAAGGMQLLIPVTYIES